MPITKLDHYYVRSSDLERSRNFYCEALGFEVMPRPAFPSPGYWLGVNGSVQVHMGEDGVAEHEGKEFHGSPASGGAIDHIAFQGTDPEAMAQHLAAQGLSPRTRYLAAAQLLQIFVADPDGVVIELNFPGVSKAPSWADQQSI